MIRYSFFPIILLKDKTKKNGRVDGSSFFIFGAFEG